MCRRCSPALHTLTPLTPVLVTTALDYSRRCLTVEGTEAQSGGAGLGTCARQLRLPQQNAADRGTYTPERCVLAVWRLEAQDQGVGRAGFCGGLSPWRASGCSLPVSSPAIFSEHLHCRGLFLFFQGH